MSGRSLRYAIVALITFVIGLVVFLPARVAAGWVEADSPVELTGVTGTLLDGQAGYASLPSGGVDNLSWQLHPWQLLAGQLSAHLTFDSDLDGFSGDISRSLFGGNTVSNLSGNATAGWLAKRGGVTFLPLSGQVAVNIGHAAFDDQLQISALAGRVNLSQMRWQLIKPPLALGSFQTVLSRGDNGITAKIADSNGPLAIDGKAMLDNQQTYDLDVRLRARAGADPKIGNLLDQLGPADAQGWHRVRERGRLSL